jgi:hypothetical protein
MSWEIDAAEVEAVLALPSDERYDYFVKRCVDWETLWTLPDASVEGARPLWPHAAFAAACAVDDWAGRTPVPIGLSEWLADKAAREQVQVFPRPNRDLEPTDRWRLAQDLRNELKRYR